MGYEGDSIRNTYWVANMVKPVRFMPAVEAACASMGSVDLIMEVGPHPALKAPILQTIQDSRPHIPYTGLLRRGASAISSFAEGLGYAWTYLGRG